MVRRQIRVKVNETWHTVEVEDPPRYPFQIIVDGQTIQVEVEAEASQPSARSARPTPASSGKNVGLTGITQDDEKIIRSPMPGRIVSVSVKIWDAVEPGREMCILETMKMEQSVLFSHKGAVRAVFVRPGQIVAVGDPIVQLE